MLYAHRFSAVCVYVCFIFEIMHTCASVENGDDLNRYTAQCVFVSQCGGSEKCAYAAVRERDARQCNPTSHKTRDAREHGQCLAVYATAQHSTALVIVVRDVMGSA